MTDRCSLDAEMRASRASLYAAMMLFAVVFSLLGIAIGSPATALRSQLGDPLLVETTSSISRTANYLRNDDPSAVLRVTERDGVVFAVEIARERAETSAGATDGHGVRLGMSRSVILALRGTPAFQTMNTVLYPEDPMEDASLIYRFDGDTLESIKLAGSGSSAPGNASLAPLTEAAGDSYTNAILDLTPTVIGSDHFRERYLTVRGCKTAGRRSTLERRDGKRFAFVSASCNDKPRRYYFDISRARP